MTELTREQAWNRIFETIPIVEGVNRDGFFDLTNTQIKVFKEPRIMCKIDFREHLPKVMKDEGLSILAIKNGTYRIARNSPFIDLNENIISDIEFVTFPTSFVSLDPNSITSESAALDVAKISGMLDLVVGEHTDLSIRGRKYCNLDFNIGEINYPVSGVQVEVDGGYEGNTSINLIEAKIGGRNNINIRQLLYPQLYWQSLARYKSVSSFIFQYQNGLYRFIPFKYDGSHCSVNHSAERVFRIVENNLAFDIYSVQINDSLTDSNAPFPQADDFIKLITFLIKIGQKDGLSKEEVGLEFDLVPRQIDYYLNGLRWMKLITIDESKNVYLTNIGKEMFSMSDRNRMIAFSKIIFSNQIFHTYLRDQITPISQEVRARFRLDEDSLYNRRMATVKAWTKYFKTFFEILN